MNSRRISLEIVACSVLASSGVAQLPRLHSFYGDQPGERLGVSVGPAGDVNADGYDDLIVGATDGNGASNEIGEAHVFSGSDGSLLYTFLAHEGGTSFGASVSGAGDVDADGHADVVVGARYDDTVAIFAGAVYVYSGRTGSLLHAFYGDEEGDRMGTEVSGAGDVNGDGHDDVIAGAFFANDNGFWSGSARVFSGGDGTVLYTFDGDSSFDFFGVDVSGAGDVDADGFADVIVGAIGNDGSAIDAGMARVFSGADGSVLHTLHGAAQSDEFGVSVGGPGDVDGDGHDDLIVGAWLAEGGAHDAGSATVFSGLDGSTLYVFEGQGADDHFGNSVGGAGDFDGDSIPDFIVGAPSDDDHGDGSGSASIYSGRDGSLLMTLFGDSPDDRFGVAVSGAGDVDSDGMSDVIVGATFDDDGGNDAGSAHVYAGLEFVRIYCTPKPGLACGTPAIRFSGFASASASSGFIVSAGPARGHCAGILIYTNGGAADVPFQGGTLCLAAPLRRGPLVDSGGTAGQCDGEFALDLNSFAAGQAGGNPAAFLSILGTRIHCQWWGRDTAATGSFLSDAVEYVVRP